MTFSIRPFSLARLAFTFVCVGLAAGGMLKSDERAAEATSPGRAAHHPMHPHRDENGRMMRGARHEAQTDNWSGYFVAQYQTGQSYTSAQGTWTIPAATFTGTASRTNTTQYSATWVGIGGTCSNESCSASDNTLIQLGTEQDAFQRGSANYYAWYEMLPADSVTIPNPVQPGDRITASLNCTASCTAPTQSWTLSMTDFTAGWSWSQTFSYASPRLSAEWIEEATSTCSGSNCTVQPLADFGTVTLSPGTANGANPFLSLDQNGIIMFDTAGQTAQPSAPVAGNAFTACWGQTSLTPCSFAAPASPLVAAILPSSRSVEIGTTATVFATMINSGSATAQGCTVKLGTGLSGTYAFQTTDRASNMLVGGPNTPVDIGPGNAQSFVLSFTPNAAFTATDTDFQFGCANADLAPINTGLDTLLLSSSAVPVPDVVALSATVSNDGILDISGTSGAAAFAVATVNVGADSGSSLTVGANTGSATLPVSFTLCQTNPSTGQCMATPTTSVSASFAANATPTFAVFAKAAGSIPFNPASSRIFVRISDTSGNIRGSTSVAVRTQ